MWWKDKETLDQWRRNQRHLVAKTLGKQTWYAYYKMEIAEVFHTSNFDSQDTAAAMRE